VIDKIGRYHQAFGNKLIAIGGHRGTLSQDQYVASLELFAAEVAPALRETIPDPDWPAPASFAGQARREIPSASCAPTTTSS
jgi:hypothetical protein